MRKKRKHIPVYTRTNAKRAGLDLRRYWTKPVQDFIRRSRAAKKGWVTRRKGRYEDLLIRTGYESRTEGNSYALVVRIQRKRKEKYTDVSDRIAHLCGEGYFDKWANQTIQLGTYPGQKNTPVDAVYLQPKIADLRFATFHNKYIPLSRRPSKVRKPAVLEWFERDAP